MNFFDEVISLFSPKMGFVRSRYRFGMEQVERLRQYDAATNSRRTKGWKATGSSANTEIEYSLKWLRNRSRDMVRNNVYARRAKRVIANNTVGAGIVPAPKRIGKKLIEAKVKKLWQDWAETTECDFDGRHTFYGLQKLVMSAVVESGEVLIRRRRYKNKVGIPLQLQIVECDIIDDTKVLIPMDGKGNIIIHGIEFDRDGKRVAYWLWDRHPGDTFHVNFDMLSKRVPAEEIAHIYYIDRPGQIRGVPFLSAAMMKMRDADNYEDTQLMRQTVAACFAVFYTDFNSTVDNLATLTKDKDTDQFVEKLEPGMIVRSPAGKDVKFTTPPPVEGYGDYMRKIQQGIAAGAGLTYEAMTGDLSNVNFSSGRMGWLEMSRDVEDWQQMMLIPSMCQPVWSWFMDACVLAGVITSAIPTQWTVPRREMLDPVKETNAKVTAARAGLKSMQELIREDGYNPEDVLKEIQEWNDLLDAAKIKLDSDARNKTNGPNTDAPAEVVAVQ